MLCIKNSTCIENCIKISDTATDCIENSYYYSEIRDNKVSLSYQISSNY